MLTGASLEYRQEEMRRRGPSPKRRTKKVPPVLAPFEQRRDEILNTLQLRKSRCMDLAMLRSLSACRPFGRGWWRATIRELCRARVLQQVRIGNRIEIGPREQIQALYFRSWTPKG